jgi:hypothetical protein
VGVVFVKFFLINTVNSGNEAINPADDAINSGIGK